MPLGLNTNKYITEEPKKTGIGLDINKYVIPAPEPITTSTEQPTPKWLTALSRPRGGGVFIPTPEESEAFIKTVLKGLDYTVKVQKAVSNAVYYASAERFKKVSPIMPSFGAKTKELPFTSMVDAIKKGWSGEVRVAPTQWVAGLFMDPREIEATREDWGNGWQKYPMKVADILSELAVSVVGWTAFGKAVSTPLKEFYTLSKIKTDKSFVDNVASAVKQTVQTPKGMPDSDIYLLKIYKKTGIKPPGGLEAIRPDVEGVKRWQAEAQNLKYNKAKADEIYAQSIREKQVVDNIPEPEHIGDQKWDSKSLPRLEEPKIPSSSDYKESQDALDYMAHEINEKKVDAHINDTQATVVKQSKDTLEQVRIQLDLDIANADRNAKLAQQGRLFLTPESEQRSIKEEYLRAYISAWEKDINPTTMTKQERGLLGAITSNRANIPNKDFGKMIEDITHQISNGRTKDISVLSSDEFSSVFDMIDSMTSIKSAIKQMNSAGIMELFNPSWDYFARMKATGVYNIPNEAGIELMRKTRSLLSEWSGYLKAVGIKTNKKMDKYGIPDANEAIARHPIGDKLRRIFLYADGINPYDPAKSVRKVGVGEVLTIDEIKFIEETMDNVASGKISQLQIDAEVNAGEFIRRSMGFFGDMGERLGFLYKPGTAKELRPEGSVVRMPNYVRHQITQILDETKNSKSPYVLDYIRKFFKHHAKEEINIDELIQRQNQRKDMVQNADVAFRSVIGHEGFKFYMEPSFKSATKLANDIDTMRGIPINADKSVSTYTAGWINTAFRGQMTDVEGRIERVIGGVRDAELATYHGLGKTVNNIRKMLKRDALEFNWEPTKYDRAFKTFSGRYRQYVYTAAMGLNPTSILKNATQIFLVHPLIGTRATLEGLKSIWVGGEDTLKYSDVFFSRGIAIHELEVSALNRVGEIASLPFRYMDQYVNCASAFNGSLWKQIYKDKSKLAILNNYGYSGKSTGNSFWGSLNKALDAGEFRGEVKMADMVAKRTQFSYLPWDMPKALWGPVGKLGMQFGSWGMNYWTQYLPYLWNMSRTGVGPFGQLSKWERQSLLKHVITMEALASTGEWAGIDISYLSPTHAAVKGALGTIGVLGGDKPTGETYQQGPFPSLPPALSAIKLLAEEYGMATSGRASKLQQIMAPGKAVLMMDQYAKPSEWPGYIPGSLPKTIHKVAEGKKSPLALFGINLTSERKVGGR